MGQPKPLLDHKLANGKPHGQKWVTAFRAVSCRGLNENSHYRSTCLTTCVSVELSGKDQFVWTCWRKGVTEWTFRFQSLMSCSQLASFCQGLLSQDVISQFLLQHHASLPLSACCHTLTLCNCSLLLIPLYVTLFMVSSQQQNSN